VQKSLHSSSQNLLGCKSRSQNWNWSITGNDSVSRIRNISHVSGLISMVVDSLETTVGQVDVVAALSVVSVSVFVVTKVQTRSSILYCVTKVVDGWAFVDGFRCRCVGRNRGGPVDGSRGRHNNWSTSRNKDWSRGRGKNGRRRGACKDGARSVEEGSGSCQDGTWTGQNGSSVSMSMGVITIGGCQSKESRANQKDL
jgi:hypothetical protein